jgi:hypothetical protein
LTTKIPRCLVLSECPLSRHSREGGNPNSQSISNQRRYNRFYQSFFIQNFIVFLSLSFVEKKVTKETTPKVDTAPTGYPPILIYSRELRDSLLQATTQTGPRSFSLNKSKHETLSKWGQEKIAITRLSLSLYAVMTSLSAYSEFKENKKDFNKLILVAFFY